MADTKEFYMNVQALRGVDPYLKDILETATHVALYTFNAEDNEWEKTDVEGALFVYSRNGEPYHSILIMNRLNIKNLVEPVTQGLDLQLQEPFLLYRNSSCRIFGVWFYDKDECIRIASVLDKLVKQSEMSKKVPDKVAVKNKRGASGDSNVDIFTMLSKAQEDYNSNKNQTNSKNSTAEETKPDMPQGVVDFFAKASGGASHFSADKVTQGAGLFVSHHPTRTELQSEPSDNQLKPLLLQRLMSNPAHTVEHIEKQQRSVTPQSEATSTKKNKGKSQSNKDNSKQNGGNYKSRPLSSGNITDAMRLQHGNVHVAQSSSSASAGLVENGMSFLRISSPTATCPQLQPFFGTGLHTSASSGMVVDASAVAEQRPLSAPLCSGIETPQKPALMPPTMFTSSATKDTSNKQDAGSTPVLVQNSSVTSVKPKPEHASAILAPGPINTVPLEASIATGRPEPLTRNQLLQAFNYLVKNDPEFVNKLHEAYVKSFAEMVM